MSLMDKFQSRSPFEPPPKTSTPVIPTSTSSSSTNASLAAVSENKEAVGTPEEQSKTTSPATYFAVPQSRLSDSSNGIQQVSALITQLGTNSLTALTAAHPAELAVLEQYLNKFRNFGETFRDSIQSRTQDVTQFQTLVGEAIPMINGVSQMLTSALSSANQVSEVIHNPGTFIEGLRTHPYTEQAVQMLGQQIDSSGFINKANAVKDSLENLGDAFSLFNQAAGLFSGGESAIASFGSNIIGGDILSVGITDALSTVGFSGINSMVTEAVVSTIGTDALLVGGLAGAGIAFAGVGLAVAGIYGLYKAFGGQSDFSFGSLFDW